MIAAHIVVKGMVQGVGFRATAQQQAIRLDLNGWVKNLPNGDVELVAEGPEERVDQFIESLKEGPSRFAKVDELSVDKSGEIEGYQSFTVTG